MASLLHCFGNKLEYDDFFTTVVSKQQNGDNFIYVYHELFLISESERNKRDSRFASQGNVLYSRHFA